MQINLLMNIELLRLFVLWLETQKEQKELWRAKEIDEINEELLDGFGTKDPGQYLSGRDFRAEQIILDGKVEVLTERIAKLFPETPRDQLLTHRWWMIVLPSINSIAAWSTELEDYAIAN